VIITEGSVVFEKAHDALVEHHSIHLNPKALLTVLETVLDGRVTAVHAERRYRQGLEHNDAQFALLREAEATLAEARELIGLCVAWTGDEEMRAEVVARIDDLISSLK
jgi:hypothetical protein